MRQSFSLYKRKTKSGTVWYAQFWDAAAGKYGKTCSLGILAEGKRERRRDAESAARAMLDTIQFAKTAGDTLFTEYVSDFWTQESPYVREAALLKKRPLAAGYIRNSHADTVLHLKPFPGFKDVTLKTLTAGIIRDWMRWAAEKKGLSGRRINAVLCAARIAVRYAVSREELTRDPFLNVHEAAETPKVKGVLSGEEVARLVKAPVRNPRSRLAVLLGVLCGLRRGEVRGLKWGDIEDSVINVCHNFIDGEGLKAPKCNSGRVVPVPRAIDDILTAASEISQGTGADDFVLCNIAGHPIKKRFFQSALERELSAIGIPGPWRTQKDKDGKEIKKPDDYVDEQKRRNLTFHGLRHTFVTLGRLSGLTDFEIQTLAGHKSGAMMEHYSHGQQVIDFAAAREKLEKAVG